LRALPRAGTRESALRGEYDLLLAKIRHANREDRSFRQGGIAEPLDVCLVGGRSPTRG
jgi:hypothetical protein